jgi:hypothetical protein
MKRFAFSGLVCVLVACGGANTTDLFSGDSTGGGGSSVDGSTSAADGSGGGGGGTDSGGGGGGTDSGSGGKVDSGTTKDSGTTGTCTVDKGGVAHGCATDEACASANCTTGVCQKVNPQANDFNPVCGCDTVNYWNGAVASAFLAGVKSSGSCGASAATCNGATPGNAKCGLVAAADCAFERPDLGGAACGAAIKNPTCWGMPQSCPKATQGVSQCQGGGCKDLCSAIKDQTPFRVTVPACMIM